MFEGIFTLAIKESQEWKWYVYQRNGSNFYIFHDLLHFTLSYFRFCPSIFLYLVSVCPSIVLIEVEPSNFALIIKNYTKAWVCCGLIQTNGRLSFEVDLRGLEACFTVFYSEPASALSLQKVWSFWGNPGMARC